MVTHDGLIFTSEVTFFLLNYYNYLLNMATKKATTTAKAVYRGYMPIDLPQHRPPNRIKPWWKVLGKPRVTLYPKKPIEGYSDEPEYPPLNDGSRKGCKTQIRLDWYKSLEAPPTAEAKLYEITRHCQHYIAHFNNWIRDYNSLALQQYLTQTHIINKLPDNYTNQPNQELVTIVKDLILKQIALDKFESIKGSPHYVSKTIRDGSRNSHVSNLFIQNLVNDVKKAVIASDVNDQLIGYQYDLSPAIRSWLYHSGFPPPNNKIFYNSRKDNDGHINQMIQINGSSSLNIRADNMIEPILSQTDPLVTDTALVEKVHVPLRKFGAEFKFKWPVALPGFWFEDKPRFDFPHTCFLSTDSLALRTNKHQPNILDNDVETHFNGQAIMTAFSWLNSLSMYHGFTPFQELEYPFTCQLVTTDGQNWLFNTYQLNAHTFHRDLGGPKKNNICWSSGQMKLFEEYKNGEFLGVNEDVVKLLIRFLGQQTNPLYTSQLNLRPYLSEDTRTEEEKDLCKTQHRRHVEGRYNKWLAHDWSVPLWEHLFFRSKENRHRITFMKPRFHIPKPKYPQIFE